YLAVKEDVSKRKAIEKALAQEQQKTDALLKNMLPEEVANEIKQTGTVAPMLFENASILFTDFSNFTTTAEQLAPKELVDLVSHYFSFFDSVIEKYNLEKLKTIGDSYMCAGGLPTPNETHAIDIIHAALDILDFVQQEKENRQRQGLLYWDVRIGISSGSVVAGVIGQKKYAYDVWGDTVVMAARMESSGEVGKVNISRTTYNLVKDKFDCYYRGKITAKNKGQVEMYFVNGFKTRKTVNQ
ncbi:MAG: adenylate/guanylate cyclase domain-containing protein, partial [Chloroflexota bacterium]|nr:adenylate/guanylate cyclase domain-containing protein [Chloroflexota bacterium]